MMEINYVCPQCRSFLNIGTKIVLSVHSKDNQRGLLLFEKRLGDYDVKKHDLIQYEKGETVGFFCPICHQNLVSEFNANLAKVIMIEENDSECEVLFSKVVGEQATYKIKNGIIEAFGADKNKYLDSLKKK
jgi:uncharacterized protein YbaR (Trm112 family)